MNEKTTPATGGCLCGAVRFEVTAAPFSIDYCHCRMCQRVSGSVLTSWADFKALEFRCTRGEIKFYRSSQYGERGFCPRCGSTLVGRDLDGSVVSVATGSFDHPEDFPPNLHCGSESQVPWLKIDDDLPHKTTREVMGFEVEN